MIYNETMPTKGTRKTINKDGVEKDAYSVTFTNGALEELEELQKRLKAPDLDSVLKVAIGITKQVEAMRDDRGRDESEPTIS